MGRLEVQLSELNEERERILGKIDDRNSKREIQCESCDEMHKIKDLVLVQIMEYEGPHGCNEGDYYYEGEIRYICPTTEVENRLLFFNFGSSFEERGEYRNDPEKQFKNKYENLFLEVEERSRKEDDAPTVNNNYVDTHRKKFQLVERRK